MKLIVKIIGVVLMIAGFLGMGYVGYTIDPVLGGIVFFFMLGCAGVVIIGLANDLT